MRFCHSYTEYWLKCGSCVACFCGWSKVCARKKTDLLINTNHFVVRVMQSVFRLYSGDIFWVLTKLVGKSSQLKFTVTGENIPLGAKVKVGKHVSFRQMKSRPWLQSVNWILAVRLSAKNVSEIICFMSSGAFSQVKSVRCDLEWGLFHYVGYSPYIRTTQMRGNLTRAFHCA